MAEIIDEPKRLDELPEEFRINRYSFRFDLETETFAVTQEKTMGYASIIGAVVFGALAFVFGFVLFSSVPEEGWGTGAWLTLGFGLFMLLLAIASVYTGYFSRSTVFFHPDHLLMTRRLLGDKRHDKDAFESVYILETTTRDQSGRETAHSIDICLKRKTAFGRKSTRNVTLFNVEEKDSAASILGTGNYQKRIVAQKEAERIGKIIELYWDIPFRV